jgi:hypothetical protein
MSCELYLVRLIHNLTKRPFPGERLWTSTQLTDLATIRFLRARNREGCDIYIHPYAQDRNAGYILIDVDDADPAALSVMRANGHEPCVVLQTSPRHWQAWVQVSSSPLDPALATAVGRHLAHFYGGDRASTDWRHLGRLAGFTNQKPHRRLGNGYPPWVKIVYTAAGLASHAEGLLQAAREQLRTRSHLGGVATDYASVPVRCAGHRDLPNLDAALAHRAAICPTRLEHRRSVGSARAAGARHVSRRRPRDSAAGQSRISPRP